MRYALLLLADLLPLPQEMIERDQPSAPRGGHTTTTYLVSFYSN